MSRDSLERDFMEMDVFLSLHHFLFLFLLTGKTRMQACEPVSCQNVDLP